MCSIHNHLQLPMHIHLIFLLHIHRSLFLASYAILIFFTLISHYSHSYRSGCELRERVVCLRVGWILDINFLSIFHYIKMQHHAMPARERALSTFQCCCFSAWRWCRRRWRERQICTDQSETKFEIQNDYDDLVKVSGTWFERLLKVSWSFSTPALSFRSFKI